jgi:hypothetical protein
MLGGPEMPKPAESEWEYFRGYADKGSVSVVVQQLELDGVPTHIEERGPMSGDQPEYWIVVPCDLAHRARWIVSQLPPEKSELTYLATKKLGEG